MRLLAINVYTPNGLSNVAALAANQSLHQFLLLVISGLSPCLAVTDPHRLVDTDSKKAHVRVLVNFNTSLSNRGENSIAEKPFRMHSKTRPKFQHHLYMGF
jgi:hypothetical protein